MEQDKKKKYSLPHESHPPEICTKQNTHKKCVYQWGMSHAPRGGLERLSLQIHRSRTVVLLSSINKKQWGLE